MWYSITVLVPLSVSAGLELFSLSLQQMNSLIVQQQERKLTSADKNHSYLWGLLKGLCNFYELTFQSCAFQFLSCCPILSIFGECCCTCQSLLLCRVWSKSWILFSLPKYFLSLTVSSIQSFLCSTLPCSFEVGISGQISMLLLLVLVTRTGLALLKEKSGFDQPLAA